MVPQTKYWMSDQLYKCTICENEYPAELFTFRKRNGKVTPKSWCKPCHNTRKNDARKSGRYVPNPDHIAATIAKNKFNRLNGLNTAVYLYQDSRKSDRKRGLENDLDHGFIDECLSKPCSYCEATDSRMTLDRIDNSLGHIKTNVVPACYRCNIVRGSMPFEAWAVIAPAMKEAYNQGLFGDWRSEPVSRKKYDEHEPRPQGKHQG